ncbi:hypothetical protein IWB18_00495 [Alkalibacter sp. M17DMB]|nr:hypothetical protein [Alkalibacter mobilis]
MDFGTIVWAGGLLACISVLVIPETKEIFLKFSESRPYISGFVKFMILATMGDLAGERILKGEWALSPATFVKAIVWGLLGMAIVLVFSIFNNGVILTQQAGKLPGEGMAVMAAFFTSLIMNVTFAPAMFLFHKYSDAIIDLAYEQGIGAISFISASERIDFKGMVEFSILKVVPFFWIPCHTAVFLLPGQYRVIASAFLSIALGLFIALNKKKEA